MTMSEPTRFLTFDSPVGWFGVVHENEVIGELKFGAKSQTELYTLFLRSRCRVGPPNRFEISLQNGLLAYLGGENVDFRQWVVRTTGMSEFQQEVSGACRAIGFGQTVSYGDLAKQVGSPGAARAVGTVMRQNRVPLIVPCHRVIAANSQLGGYSAASGNAMKRHLLELESALLF